LICFQASASGITFTPPAGGGWTSLARNSNATRSATLEVFWKVAVGGDSAPSVACSSAAGGWCTQIMTYRGVNITTPEDTADVSSDSAAAGTWQPTGISVTTAGGWVLSLVGTKDDNALNFSVANGYTLRMSGASYDDTAGNGSDYSIGLSDQEFASTGAKTCPTWNQSANGTDAWVGLTMCLKPQVQTILTPGSLSVTITKYAPTVAKITNLTPGSLSVTITKYAPTVGHTTTLTPATRTLAITTYAPTVEVVLGGGATVKGGVGWSIIFGGM